jgi:ligand-binding sensor domain-containing protein
MAKHLGILVKKKACRQFSSRMLKDRIGHLWFGTGQGVTSYDGKTFRHFTEKEGLSHNSV